MEKHLFILSGQSNMVGLNPNNSFVPLLVKEFGKSNVIVVKDAEGAQSIRRWDKSWSKKRSSPQALSGDLYERLLRKVRLATNNIEIKTVSFIWMQGEQDAWEKNGDIYAESLQNLLDQLRKDLNRQDIFCVVGRLSDHDLNNRLYKHWSIVRNAQEVFVKRQPMAAIVNTDDLNEGASVRGYIMENDLHYSDEGYKLLGERFAKEAIKMIKKYNVKD